MEMLEFVRQMTAHPAWKLLWPLFCGLGVFLMGLVLRRFLMRSLSRWAAATKWQWDDLLVAALRGPFVLWCLMAGLYVAVVASPASTNVVSISGKILSVLWIFSLTLVALRIADQIIRKYGTTLAATLPLTSLTQNLAKGIILVVGALIILNSLGISIAPMLTALGIGGLAVALALQDTLSNLFSGIYVTAARQVRVGDYIKLESGEEGYVVDIAWRSTRIRNLPNNLIVIPNTKLAQAIVTNYDLPSKDLAVLAEVGVDYRSDLEQVERVTCAVGKQVMQEVPGGVPEFDPFIRYHTFGDSSINFTVILRAKTFVDQYLVKHEFVKRLHRAFTQEGITIPFPIRTVIMQAASPASAATQGKEDKGGQK